MKTPDLFFPQLNRALIVRKNPPKGARFVTSYDAHRSVYLIEATSVPRGAQIAHGPLGGWNYPDGTVIHLLYAESMFAFYKYCHKENADRLVKTRVLENGVLCNLVKVRTTTRLNVGCTPVIAEEALAEDE
jgi:hypothetical protein